MSAVKASKKASRLFRSFQDETPASVRDRARDLASKYLGERPGLPLAPGDHVGNYEVIEVLGSGGQAVVYKARHRHIGRVVALKVPRREVGDHLLREARLAARLEHPRIARVEDIQLEGPVSFMILEYCEGGSLEDRLDAAADGGLPLDEVRRVSHAVLRALDFAHSRGVVHRDVKPANILFKDDKLKVADFGIGTLSAVDGLSVSVELSQASLLAGTPLYVAPEQEKPELREGGKLDGRADLFSFGKILFQMLTGASPRTVRPPSRVRKDLDPAWDEYVFKLIEERPQDRFANALEAALAMPPEMPAFAGRGAVAMSDGPLLGPNAPVGSAKRNLPPESEPEEFHAFAGFPAPSMGDFAAPAMGDFAAPSGMDDFVAYPAAPSNDYEFARGAPARSAQALEDAIRDMDRSAVGRGGAETSANDIAGGKNADDLEADPHSALELAVKGLVRAAQLAGRPPTARRRRLILAFSAVIAAASLGWLGLTVACAAGKGAEAAALVGPTAASLASHASWPVSLALGIAVAAAIAASAKKRPADAGIEGPFRWDEPVVDSGWDIPEVTDENEIGMGAPEIAAGDDFAGDGWPDEEEDDEFRATSLRNAPPLGQTPPGRPLRFKPPGQGGFSIGADPYDQRFGVSEVPVDEDDDAVFGGREYDPPIDIDIGVQSGPDDGEAEVPFVGDQVIHDGGFDEDPKIAGGLKFERKLEVDGQGRSFFSMPAPAFLTAKDKKDVAEMIQSSGVGTTGAEQLADQFFGEGHGLKIVGTSGDERDGEPQQSTAGGVAPTSVTEDIQRPVLDAGKRFESPRLYGAGGSDAALDEIEDDESEDDGH